MSSVPYRLLQPSVQITSVIFSSPHSGRDYPRAFLRDAQLSEHMVRSSEDAFVDMLFDSAPAYGAPFLAAMAPRAYVDLNRASDELDPALIEGLGRVTHNPRISSGLGVIPRVVANGRVIRSGKIPLDEARARLRDYWHPYHDCLQDLLDSAHYTFREAILVDCHSMPHEALDSLARRGGRRPEVVLGDRFGASASSEVVDRIEEAFRRAGLRTVRNAPFAGGYITQHYGRPSRNQHAVQIEIDRSLYMNEQQIRPNSSFEQFRDMMRGVIEEIAQVGRRNQKLAAE
ncbi:N-formylglutamate amidohydrolase [Actibacterium sp. XHP0104]|uniref:N-formylglutamate amidohydrolase n=1 Tax=Actibacterium sp. XHP0104 TaxID=2984335 RepID=UPI0021E8A8BC|nr:N-formylglutamate amidohydrolase [Actibacterium sp. XHP0104]MCV2881902.1 N-formylglutamate amidohydrolase [Actibacterium sp. XHP0104]